jgi:peptidoglycan/LPS O-acetylase OafA/YrhL
MFVAGATVSVDTFLLVGGLVTVYTYLKATSKGVKFNLFLFYLHRYLRLTPALAVMSLIHLYLINHFGNGPLWKIIDLILAQPCREAWWSTFLYITNYVQRGDVTKSIWYSILFQRRFVSSACRKVGTSLLTCNCLSCHPLYSYHCLKHLK